ncbi:uncharacterized protein UBRO_20940 [Ustilago bromivora]|uniref:Reverse transcriptase Ty1/copia-type domain-containing protein n=1 Tax=Ustilago bromivora TaxID=307758 RepID=A0A1K0GCY4_9BASI|nr:uncharacterized protein UBRO_20940 [Ustilago bromivora]
MIDTKGSLCGPVLSISYCRQLSTVVRFSINQLTCATVNTTDAHVQTDAIATHLISGSRRGTADTYSIDLIEINQDRQTQVSGVRPLTVSLAASQVNGRQMLTGWMDSDWVGSQECCRSMTGYIFAIDRFICSWSSRLQPTVANSLVKAEYVALAAAAREMLWASMFLHKLNQSLPRTSAIHITAKTLVLHLHNGELALTLTILILYSDLSGARVIANNPQHFKRTKHINIIHFFLRDEVADGQLTIAPHSKQQEPCRHPDQAPHHTETCIPSTIVRPDSMIRTNQIESGCWRLRSSLI